ncbi:SDR family oxidoreductase [Segnochrobactrum spirostomi]|uniref:SDR family oxidoreductase n=1 Tax=Segnochrobactrum spirostomi TaxID=2608987 RepID=A0A6A7XY87_9HYPH|nr:SDR family oxidoreductase [Segnochrobactrum spirostomi]MQT11343.1 SDR family oxidoreductase [Segnochrobactrum spirostomi]
MDLELRGARALVLGGNKGLGRGVAEALAGEGATVAIVGRDAAASAETLAVLKAKAAGSRAFAADLSDSTEVTRLIATLDEDFPAIDIVVLNGGGPPVGSAAAIDPAAWRHQFETMVLANMRIATHLLPGMRDRRFGRILIVASVSVREPIEGLVMSNSLRGAVAGWAKTLADEVAGDGVTVNLLLPGSHATARIESFVRADAERRGLDVATVRAENAAAIPVRRFGTPEEFGAAAAFLASRKAGFITGTALTIDGGAARSML